MSTLVRRSCFEECVECARSFPPVIALDFHANCAVRMMNSVHSRRWRELVHPRFRSWLSHHSLPLVARHSPFRLPCRKKKADRLRHAGEEGLSGEALFPADLGFPAAFDGPEVSFVMQAEDTRGLPSRQSGPTGRPSNEEASTGLIADSSPACGGERQTPSQEHRSSFFSSCTADQTKPSHQPPSKNRFLSRLADESRALSEVGGDCSEAFTSRPTACSAVPAVEETARSLLGRSKKKREVRVFRSLFPYRGSCLSCRSVYDLNVASNASGSHRVSLAGRCSTETKARFLLGLHRADPSGLMEAVGEDKEVLLAVFRLAGMHKLRRCRWVLRPLKEKVIEDMCKFEVDEIATLARSMHQVRSRPALQ